MSSRPRQTGVRGGAFDQQAAQSGLKGIGCLRESPGTTVRPADHRENARMSASRMHRSRR